ncbi:MAG: hemerythrin domain-containing protein [Thiomonas sp.]
MLPSDDSSDASFDQPYALLRGCHARIERMDALLLRLIDHVRTIGADAQAQQAAAKVMRYFDRAAPLHHEDEELHVFPLLRQQGGEDEAARLDRLEADHRALAALWATLRIWLQQMQDGRARSPDAQTTEAAVRFSALHAEHIALENTHIFPAALACMSAAQLAAMGQDMAARRGVRWPTG